MAFNEVEEKGLIYINEGAVNALCSSDQITSLLPIGIIKIEGTFKKGDIVRIVDEKGKSLGMGIAQYGVDKAQEYVGKKGKKALVHYDYLVME